MSVTTPSLASRKESAIRPLDVAALRRDFPALHQTVHGKPLVYLDNAATSQTPLAVIDAMRKFYLEDCANVHRGVHELSQRATDDYEGARTAVQKFIGAAEPEEVIYTRGTTDALNLVAHSYGRTHVQAGDEVIISTLEHHSNIVPWQILCDERGATLRVIPINDEGELLMDEYAGLLSDRTRIVRRQPRVERSRDGQSGSRDYRHGAPAGHPGSARRRSGYSAHEGRRSGTRLRLLCLLGPQNVRADRHWHSSRQTRAA